MKITKLELSGFKSFADTVTIHFEEGVTAIVGPNGCGKSNVSDAVRWVLGAQSARLLRGGKMEDVIFQGAAGRRPVNVTEVSLFLDNSDGLLPIAYQEVQITRRLSRSGQSDYLLNKTPVRLRDISDLLRGTGMGSDAGVVIESKMIDLLLSDRAGERRSLFEEAAGIGLYRDRKESTERRLEETAHDLQRVEDLIAEVQSQIRSLARQKGKAERHVKLMDEKFAVDLTLAQLRLERLANQGREMEQRHARLTTELPQARDSLRERESQREEASRHRSRVEQQRAEITRRLSEVQVRVGKLDGDLALAQERLDNTALRRQRATDERLESGTRAAQAGRDAAEAEEERAAAQQEREGLQGELDQRTAAEQQVRDKLGEQRDLVRRLEEKIQQEVHRLRSLEGERAAVEEDLAALREQLSHAQSERSAISSRLTAAEEKLAGCGQTTAGAREELRTAAAEADRRRHELAEAREQEVSQRAALRRSEEALAQISARQQALEDLERDRVGLAPGAAALLAARDRFGDAVIGPLSDFLKTDERDAALAERVLGEWVHAVLVTDHATLRAVQSWHREADPRPGALVLLPGEPSGPNLPRHPLEDRFSTDSELARRWLRAILSGTEALDSEGLAVKRLNGAVLLSAGVAPSGPLQRRAELARLEHDLGEARTAHHAAERQLADCAATLAEAEQQLDRASSALEQARDAERAAAAAQEDASREVAALGRDQEKAAATAARLGERVATGEARMKEIDEELERTAVARARSEEDHGRARVLLGQLEDELEKAREARVHWQVQAAHVDARLSSAADKLERSRHTQREAEQRQEALAQELAQLDAERRATESQQADWKEQRAEARVAVLELEAAAADSQSQLREAEAALAAAEADLARSREKVEALNEEHHRIELRLTEASAEKRAIIERLETEWRRPMDTLLRDFEPLDTDLETLESESARIRELLDKIGPVNPLAMEEHAEEVKRLEFLTSQRDDLVAARQSLIQAIREIDTTARTMFLETFEAIRENFDKVFQTLFGGGECDLRLAEPDSPLESEIEIHAAPRGKRTQRIHLLSSGERTLVAVSLLFSIYLTKPSPFCLMDEVDAPLDDSNVGRFTRLLDEFKPQTQFIVITHNPRTMHSADAIYGVTMQEPGVSTIVGVRLGEHHGQETAARPEREPAGAAG